MREGTAGIWGALQCKVVKACCWATVTLREVHANYKTLLDRASSRACRWKLAESLLQQHRDFASGSVLTAAPMTLWLRHDWKV